MADRRLDIFQPLGHEGAAGVDLPDLNRRDHIPLRIEIHLARRATIVDLCSLLEQRKGFLELAGPVGSPGGLATWRRAVRIACGSLLLACWMASPSMATAR